MLTLGLGPQAFDNLAKQTGDVGRRLGQRQLSGLDARKLEKLLDELNKAVDLGVSSGQEVSGNDRVFSGAVRQRFDYRLDGGEWRPKLMGDVRDEVPADELGTADVG